MPSKKNSDPKWTVVFVPCELDKATKEKVKDFDPDGEWTLDAIDRMVLEGYKISISQDKYHDCVGAFCTMPDIQHPSHGQCLTARGPGWLSALKVLAYKHFTVLDGNWGTEVSQERSKDEWG